jgi:predicted ATPase
MSFFSEIKRRKVFRVAVAYGAGAITLGTVANLVETGLEDRLAWLDGLQGMTIVLLIVAFPVVMVISWLFDWTPQGLVRDTGDPATADRSDRGQTLDELIATGRMSTSRLMRLAAQMSDAIAGRHDRKVFGGLSPASFTILADDRIRIRSAREVAAGSSVLDRDASAYTAPECISGSPPDALSDQFGFGAILYEMATGRRAFLGADKDETLAAVAHSEPVAARRFNAEISMPLQWAIEKCLSKSPRQRYTSFAELKLDLEAIAATVLSATSARFASAHNLPAPRLPLIGREADIREISTLVLDADSRLLTLTGAGGIGKTRLLIELGRLLADHFEGGVYFVPLDRVQDSEFVVSEIAKAMNIVQTSGSSAQNALLDYLRQFCVAPTLLLVDNFEHVLEAAPELARLLEASAEIRIIVTSRAALRIYGECEHAVQPLVIADDDASADELRASAAVRLFVDRAPSLTEQPGDAEIRIIADICARLDGLPLAIELAAARTRVLPLAELAKRVREPLKVLSGGARDLPARQQTLLATLEWSYQLLGPGQRKLFERLGVFVGGATLEAIEAVCDVDQDLGGDLVEAVEALVDNSLLRTSERKDAAPRFAMLETMRAYALSLLNESPNGARTRKAHAAYCLVLTQEAAQPQSNVSRESAFERIDHDRGNIHAALDWLIDQRDADWSLKMANGLYYYWIRRTMCEEGLPRVLKIAALTEKGSRDHAHALALAGDLTAFTNQTQKAIELLSASLALARAHNDISCVLHDLNSLAVNARHVWDLESARRYLEEALEVATRSGLPLAMRGGMLSNLGDNAMHRGDYDLARKIHEDVLRLFSDTGDETAVAWSLSRLGDVALSRGDSASARHYYEKAMKKFQALDDKPGVASCHFDIAMTMVDSNDYVRAEQNYAQALAIYRQVDQETDYPRVLEAMARCAVKLDKPGRALVLSGGAAAIRQADTIRIREDAQNAIDQCVDEARKEMSDTDATTQWLSGFGMTPAQIVAFALEGSQTDSGE